MLIHVTSSIKFRAPTSYLVDPASPDFKPGQIAELFDSKPGLFPPVLLCRPYTGQGSIVGIIDDTKDTGLQLNTTTNRIKIWDSRGDYQTDQFDDQLNYQKGDNLYVDRSAKLTNYLSFGSPSSVVAVVIKPPVTTHPVLTFDWIYPAWMTPAWLAKQKILYAGRTQASIPEKKSGPAKCKCGYDNEYADPNQPYECYSCRNNI